MDCQNTITAATTTTTTKCTTTTKTILIKCMPCPKDFANLYKIPFYTDYITCECRSE